MAGDIYLDNDYRIEHEITTDDAATGAQIAPSPALTGLTGRLSATPGGAAINAVLSVALAVRTGDAKRYVGYLQGDDLRAQLAAAYLDRTVYLVVGDGLNVLTSDPKVVRATRAPGV